MWDMWYRLLTSVADKHAQLTTNRVRLKPSPWLMLVLKKLTVHRNYLRQAVCSGDPRDWKGVSIKLLKIEITIIYDSQKPHFIIIKLNIILVIVVKDKKRSTN